MTEITSPITTSTLSAPSAQLDTNNNVTTTTITPPSIPPENGSEYQRSYSWKLPTVTINRPKERTKSEYQREFTWKNDPPSTPSPAPSPALIPPSPIPQESLTECNTPEPIRPSSTTVSNNAVDYVGSKLSDLKITNKNNSTSSLNETTKHNGNFVLEPDDYTLEKFNSNNNANDKWKDGLRNPEPRLASGLDSRTKKIVALEANRLSKKSRSYSMYSLHDQLKVCETANDLSSPFDTEYKSEFVSWKEYGTVIREDTADSKRRQTMDPDRTLRRRGSWSAPANTANNLPAPLKWLEDLNLDLGSRANTREKLQPTITDSKSIRGITTTITAKPSSRSNRDYNYYDEKRPTTSAEFRDYRYERPSTSADVRDYPRPVTSLRDYRYDDDDNYYNTRRNFDYSYSKKDRNPSPLRSATTLGHYKDTPDVSNQYYDNYERINNNKYDDRKYDDRKYDERKHDDRKYDERKYDDRKYDERKYDDRKYDDRKYDNRKYDDRKYDDRRRENGYEDRKRDPLYDDHRRENDRQRDSLPYDHDYRRRDNNNDYDYDYKHNNRAVQTSDQEHFYNLGHSRNPSYASSNKGSVHDESTNSSGASLPYLDAVRHRSSVSSLSSVSTPSSPATPTGYDMNDYRWKRSSGLDPRIYKEHSYSPSVISKSSSGSHNKYWQFEDEKDKNYHPSALSPSRNKFYVDDDDDESIGGYSSKRHSHDYKPLNSSAMRYSSQYSPTPTRSTSPSRESYGSSRRHYQKSANHSNYSSRPPSRATSVSSHATSIEEESAVLTDILKEAEMMTLKNLSEQMSIFKQPVDLSGIGVKNVKNSGRATPSVKRSSLAGQKKPTTTTTTTTKTKSGVKTSKTSKTTTPPTKTTRTSSKIGAATTAKGVVPPSNKKTLHRPASSLSSISSTSSYREAYQPPPTNFTAAREALSRARMKVEEMLEIVSNGGTLD